MTDAKRVTKPAWIRSALDEYEGPLTGYAARITGDVESAKDVVQEVFLRLCSEDPVRLNSRLAPWLFTVCRNRALDLRRKGGRMQALGDADTQTLDAVERDPAAIVEGREGAGQVARVVAQLPDNQQEVIRLRFQHSLSYKEIAGVTKLSVSNVGYLIHTALRTIRERMDAEDYSEPRP